MSALCRSVFNTGKNIIFPELRRNITLAPVQYIKQIVEKKEGKTLILEGKITPDPNQSRYLKLATTGACPLCATGLQVKHTDVLILSQFMRPDGCVLPQRITGLCFIQQRRVETMVAMAQKAGLMINLTPDWCRKDPKKRSKWKKYNTYFDEKTIPQTYRDFKYRE